MRMSQPLGLMMLIVVGLCSAQRASAVSDEQVRKAIDKGVKYLYSQIEEWGHWDIKDPKDGKGHAGKQYAGTSSLATYALLSSGEQWQNNPKLQKVLKFLAKAETKGTYAVGLRAHVWPKLPDKSTLINFKDELKDDAYALEQGLNAAGGYRYELGDNGWDNSCVQYGVLGMWECAKRGAAPGVAYWQKVGKHFLSCQSEDGGWSYSGGGGHGRGSNLQMTAAGLACMYIVLDYVHSADFKRPGVSARHPIVKSINAGLERFNQLYKPSTNGYNMVGVERVGLASGQKYFNKLDWYQTGAAAFIKSQKADGSLGTGRGGVVSTSFSLVFLSRGRVPVFANKLMIPDQPWNNRPRDLANVTRWASDEFEVAMNWQVIGLNTPSSEWLDAPILYLASHKALELNEQQIKKIKQYINLGGLLVTTDDAGNGPFTKWVKSTFEEAYGRKFQRVDKDDDLFNIVFKERNFDLDSIHNGVRHLVIHIPRDAGGTYQMHSHRNETPWHIMGNIFQYAIEKSKPRVRLAQHFVKGDGSGTKVHIARAKYEGNWNPEPAAWSRAGAISKKAKFGVQDIALKDIGGADVSLVHVAGTESVTFKPEEVEAIKQFVSKDGGVILFEAAGGQAAFADSVRRMMRDAFPDERIKLVSSTSRILTGADINGYDATRVDYRVFYKQRLGATVRPGLLAVTVNGEPRIIISPEDLSNGMINQPVWGVFGYSSQSAMKLASNIALHAASLKPATGAASGKAAKATAPAKPTAVAQR